MLKNAEGRKQYVMVIDKAIEEIDVNDTVVDRDLVRGKITETAEQSISVLKRSKNEWYNSQCKNSIETPKSKREPFKIGNK